MSSRLRLFGLRTGEFSSVAVGALATLVACASPQENQAIPTVTPVAPPAAVSLQLPSTAVAVGDSFQVQAVMDTRGQPINAAAVYLNFDPSKLQVVTSDPDSSGLIKPGTTLDVVLQDSGLDQPTRIRVAG